MIEDLEMKKQNEEILSLWRGLGFLNGFKEGSQMEWRCAKSYDLMANVLQGHVEGVYPEIMVVSFAVIRACIASNRPRVNRIIRPEEIIEPYMNVSFEKIDKCLSANGKKVDKYMKRWVALNGLDNESIGKILNLIATKKLDTSVLKCVFEYDIEAALSSMFAQYLNFTI